MAMFAYRELVVVFVAANRPGLMETVLESKLQQLFHLLCH